MFFWKLCQAYTRVISVIKKNNKWKAYKRVTLFHYEYPFSILLRDCYSNQSKIKLLEGSTPDVWNIMSISKAAIEGTFSFLFATSDKLLLNLADRKDLKNINLDYTGN